MFATNWVPLQKSLRKVGPVWHVYRRNGERKEFGYFKYSTAKSRRLAGPMIANEYISYRLASMSGLDAAEFEFAKVEGIVGGVSIVKPIGNLASWNQLRQRKGMPVTHFLSRPEQLLNLFVFDTWICNLDRHGGNLITYPVGRSYDFYLIDHGLSLLGALCWRGVHWPSPYWNHVSKYNRHYVAGLISSIRSAEQLEPFIYRIQQIPARSIEHIISEVPSCFLNRKQAGIIYQLLLSRQKDLPSILALWFQKYKKSTSTTTRHTCEEHVDDYYYYY